MRNTIRRLLGLAMALCLVLSLVPALSASPAANPLESLYLGDIALVEDGAAVNPFPELPGEGEVRLREEDGAFILELDSFDLACVYAAEGDAETAISAEGDLIIELYGENSVAITAEADSYIGAISVENGDLTIRPGEDGATLSLSAEGIGFALGIYNSGGCTCIEDCAVDIRVGSAPGEVPTTFMFGFWGDVLNCANAAVTVSQLGATLDSGVMADEITLDAGSVLTVAPDGEGSIAQGVSCFALNVLGGSTLTAEGEECGVYADEITVSGEGKLGAAAGAGVTLVEDKDDELFTFRRSVGLFAGQSLTVDGGEVIAYGGDVFPAEGDEDGTVYDSYGIYLPDDEETEVIVKNGGKVRSAGGSAGIGNSCGVYSDAVTVTDGVLFAVGGAVSEGYSTGIDTYDCRADGEECIVIGMGGDISVEGQSEGINAVDLSVEGSARALFNGGHTPLDDSIGADVETVRVSGDGYLYCLGGGTEDGWSYGVCCDGITAEGGTLIAVGGSSVYGKSYGIDTYGLLDVSGEAEVRAYGGAAPDSLGIYIWGDKDDEADESERLALTVRDSASVTAEGGLAEGEESTSTGLHAFGRICLEDAARLSAYAAPGSGNGIAVSNVGEYYDLSLSGESKLEAEAFDMTNGALGVGCTGVLRVGEDSLLYADVTAAHNSAALIIYNGLELGGVIQAYAKSEDGEGHGLVLPAPAGPLRVEKGILDVGGTTAAVIAMDEETFEKESVTVIAPIIEYLEDYYDLLSNVAVEPDGDGLATLVCGEEQKELMAGADGTISALALADVDTALSYGGSVAFTARVSPRSFTKVVEERWERENGYGVSSLDEDSTLYFEGSYRYRLVLAPVSDAFRFDPEGVYVRLGDETYVFFPEEDGTLVLTGTDADPFVPEVYVQAPAEEGEPEPAETEPTETEPAETEPAEPVAEKTESAVVSAETLAQSGDGAEIALERGTVKLDAETAEALAQRGEALTVRVSTADDGSFTVDAETESGKVDAALKVALPAPTAGQTLVLVQPDGSETPVAKSLVEDGTVYAVIPAGSTLRLTGSDAAYPDVPAKAWYAAAVDFVSGRGLFRGTEKGFEPNQSLSRAMLVTVLQRLEGAEATLASPFADVAAGAWYADAVAWAAENGIVNGTDRGFAPDENVTREQFAAILYRYAAYLGLDTGSGAALDAFRDSDELSDWAQEPMRWAVGAGLFRGDDAGALNPKGETTRAEAAILLQRMVELIVK